ncbi:hypothetical protein LOTGIDRAFT_229627 [Lottia gigantea]|uniref:Uncharacterized protein n=1 Tax=Lottia gigantea TaxID=225164 RepID=V3Z0U6_LOTGI|nr:hypothetical protein LOTGIDRAFT_229627 [Lottia gigantea]ESO84133.1 hypothetical protein LOTGIDRAFT_229627 [Lottia gigantea]
MAAVTFKSPSPFHSGDVSRRSLLGTNLDKVLDINEPIPMENEPINSYRSVELSDLRQSYENQKSKLKQFDDSFRETHTRALNFQITEPHGYAEQPKIVNVSGLNEALKPEKPKFRQSHYGYPYKIMGDVFCSATESGRGSSRTPQVDVTPRLGRRSDVRNDGFNAEFLTHNTFNSNNNSSNSEAEKSGPSSILKLPANIRHTFGSRNCDELLSDTVKVHDTIEKQNQLRRPISRNITNVGQSSKSKTPLTDYEDLGHNTRVNLFPGSHVKNEISATKSDFNERVFLNREPESDKYKMKRDELSTWAERNVIRERLKKAWDGCWTEHNILRQKESIKWQEYVESIPKQIVTWDRSATRTKPPPQIQPVQQPRKRQQRPKPSPKVEEIIRSPLEDEYVFKTPPLTPPPVLPSPEKLPENFQKDDDFWEFFDQPIPK